MGDFSIKDFAELYSLNVWDWFAAIIAVSSLIIAISSLIIACKTLKSQKETQKNTAPIVTMEVQELLWVKLIEKLYSNLAKLHALQVLLIRSKYKRVPEEGFIKDFCIVPENYIHEELFYNNANYRYVHELKEELLTCNRYLDSIANNIHQKVFNKNQINRMYEFINYSCGVALGNYEKVFYNSTETSIERFKEKFKDKIFKHIKEFLDIIEDNGLLNYKIILKKDEVYSREDEFVEYFNSVNYKDDLDFNEIYREYTSLYVMYWLSRPKVRTIVLEEPTKYGRL